MEARGDGSSYLWFVIGVVLLFYGFLGYSSGRPWLSSLVGGVGAILLGVAEYLPSRWRVVATTLRIIFLLSLVTVAVLLVARLLS